MIFIGEQGSGKTSRGRMLKLSIDPTRGNVRGRPKSAEDLAISVWRTLIAVFDNLSKLDQEMSDWLCRLSEGGALPKRKLFTDSEEVLIEAARPIILTAIPDIAQSGDLVDRSVFVHCDPLAEQLNEQELLDRFEAFRPELLTFLIDAVACALGRVGAMPKEHKGLRRGDWASWVEAAAPALGIRAGRFLESYRRNRDQSVCYALAVDPVAAAVLAFLEVRAAWSGEASALHTELEGKAREQHSGRIPLGWPSLTHHLVSRLRRLAPMLRRVGVQVEQTRDPKTDRSIIRLSNVSSRPRKEARNSASGASESPWSEDRPEAPEAHSRPSAAAPRASKSSGDGAARPNGADPDSVVDQVVSGEICRFCGCAINGQAAEQIDGWWYHSEACAAEHRQKAPPEPRKSRIKRGRAAK